MDERFTDLMGWKAIRGLTAFQSVKALCDSSMLLSNQHNFLFVHLAKTGGTSIRAVLRRGRWLDPLGWPMFMCHRVSHLFGHRIGCKIPRHAPILVAKEMLPPAQFDRLFKFAFVRNPWDRMVSAYFHFQRERQDLLTEYRLSDFPQFATWLLETSPVTTRRATLIEALRRPQWEHLVDLHGRLLVDFIGRYENLEDDFQLVLRRVSMVPTRLPHRRAGGPRGDYRGQYNDAIAERVGEHFAIDLQALGYRFDSPNVPANPRKHVLESGREVHPEPAA